MKMEVFHTAQQMTITPWIQLGEITRLHSEILQGRFER